MGKKLGILVAALALAATACGGASASNGNEPSETTTSAAGAAPVTVNVVATDYAFKPDLTTFKVGVTYHFVVENEGQVEHEFMIVKPITPGEMDMEEMDAMAIGHIEEDDLQPGQTASVDVTFSADEVGKPVEISCHLEGHYEAGMHVPITIES